MTNIKAAKVQAKEVFQVAYDKIQAITVKGGFLGLQNESLDWNSRMIIVSNLLWDLAVRQKQTTDYLIEEVETMELTTAAEETAVDIDTFLIGTVENLIENTITDWNENFKTLTISEEIIDLVETSTETLTEQVLLISELTVLLAKAVRSDLRSINEDDSVEEMDTYIKWTREIAQDLVNTCFASYEAEEVASAPSAVNDLGALFNAINA
jgi:hypothetical protein